MAEAREKLLYGIAVLMGVVSGILHVGVQDPLLTALVVLSSTMVLGFLRPERPWRWVLLVGLCVPLVMIIANVANYYRDLTRAGIAGSVLIILPGFAGAYGGHFGRKVVNVIFEKP